MRVSYKNHCFEVTEAWVVDGYFRFKTVDGGVFGVELEDNYEYRDDPIGPLCSNGGVRLDNYAKKTTTIAELEVYTRYEGEKEESI